MMNTNSQIDDLKLEYVEYFKDVPVQKYAAMYVGRDEDTIIRWKREDTVFADAVEKAKAGWIRKRVLATKSEFALERLEKSVFSEKSTIELDTGQILSPIDPNSIDAKRLVEQSLQVLMDLTSQKAPPS